MEMAPLTGSITAPWTKAAWAGFDSWHGPLAGLVATSWNGVANPCAVNGFAGTIRLQSPLIVLAARDCRRGIITIAAATAVIMSGISAATRIHGLRCQRV